MAFIYKHIFKDLIQEVNKELGQVMVSLQEIKKSPNLPYTSAYLHSNNSYVLDAYVKLKNTNAIQAFEKQYKAVLAMDGNQLRINF